MELIWKHYFHLFHDFFSVWYDNVHLNIGLDGFFILISKSQNINKKMNLRERMQHQNKNNS